MSSNKFKTVYTGFAGIVIPVLAVVAFVLYFFVMGNPQNFQGNNLIIYPNLEIILELFIKVV